MTTRRWRSVETMTTRVRDSVEKVRFAVLVGVLALTTGAGPADAQVPSWAQSRSCEAGGEPRIGLGVGTWHCQGGTCVVGGIYAGATPTVRERLEGTTGAWDFSVEPRLWEIRAHGPTGGAVQEGDLLVAVDGAPLTTREAGRRLAAMKPEVPVTLSLRRDGGGGGIYRVEVVPVESCEAFRVSSGPEPMPSYLDFAQGGRVVRRGEVDRSLEPIPVGVSRARFEGAGLVLAGPTEVRVDAEGSAEWRFTDLAVVAEVVEGGAADVAGIVEGEVVVSAADEPLDTPEGVAALAAAAPDRPVLLFVRRGSSGRQVMLHER